MESVVVVVGLVFLVVGQLKVFIHHKNSVDEHVTLPVLISQVSSEA